MSHKIHEYNKNVHTQITHCIWITSYILAKFHHVPSEKIVTFSERGTEQNFGRRNHELKTLRSSGGRIRDEDGDTYVDCVVQILKFIY